MQNYFSFKKPKAIIFDWDNTIIDSWQMVHLAYSRSLEMIASREVFFTNEIHEKAKILIQSGHATMDYIKNNIKKSMREYFPEIFGADWALVGSFYRSNYLEISKMEIRLIDGIMEIFNKAKNLGIMQVIISNKDGKILRDEVLRLGLTQYFHAIIGEGDAKKDKPSKEVVELAFAGTDIDVNSDNAWFIGDTDIDIECAINSGAKPIFFNQDNKTSKYPMEKFGVIEVKTHAEILAILSQFTTSI